MTMTDDKFKLSAIETFVVVIVLTSVAAVVTPRLSVATDDARLTKMVSSLQKVRTQIQLYKIQHDGLLPGQKQLGENIRETDFVNALTGPSSESGRPYLDNIPVNPFNGLYTVTCVSSKDLFPDGTEGTGWWFNAATGKFHACDSAFHAKY
jgi:type II secretory pathway pseudopilin PulG